ncbi:MAG: PAS domain S-box protein [Chitinophagaceae bacterium]|nr:PAS domain S-box protein [Chitinophagaceae bacterium]
MELTIPDFQIIFQSIPGNYLIVKPDAPHFTIVAVSDDYASVTNTKRENILGKGLFEVFPDNPDDPYADGVAKLTASLETVIRKRKPHTMSVQHYDIPNPDGSFSIRYWSSKNSPVFNEHGNLSCIIHHVIDISEQVEVKKKLHTLELDEQAYDLFMQAPVAISILKGTDYIVALANDRVLELWGKSPDVIGKSALTVLPELQEQGFMELLDRVRESGEPYYAYETIVILIRQGKEKTLYLNSVYQPYYEPNGNISGVVMIATDVTEQVIARKKVEESERQFRQIADSMPQIVWTSRPDGYLDYYNKQWYEFTGFKEGYGDQSWIPILHPDDVKYCYDTWYHAVQTGEQYLIEYRFRDRIHGDYRWFLGKALPIKDDQGNIIKWFGTCTDIHDQKIQAERLEEQVTIRTRELKEKNSELEQFAQVSSHDLQEPLRKILIYTDMVKNDRQNSLTDRSKLSIDKVCEATQRMSNSLRELLNYTSTAKTELFTIVDLNDVVKNVLDDLELVITRKNALVNTAILPLICAIPLQMQQLFYNLLNNALKFSKPDTEPVIDIATRNLEAKEIRQYSMLIPEKEYIEITIRDNGIGFEQKYADHIFVMFQRLNDRSQFEGTGIGLSLCKKVVDNHGGIISVTSNPGEGAVFSIVLAKQ